MSDLLAVALNWRLLGVVVLVFGFFPGFFLRLILLLYPSGHARRAELLGELYALPYIERPVFVAQQLETGLFEGIGQRLSQRRAAKPKAEASPSANLEPTEAPLSEMQMDRIAAEVATDRIEQRRQHFVREAVQRRHYGRPALLHGAKWVEDLYRRVGQADFVAMAKDDAGNDIVAAIEAKHRRRWRAGES